jgi:hypothetical protein
LRVYDPLRHVRNNTFSNRQRRQQVIKYCQILSEIFALCQSSKVYKQPGNTVVFVQRFVGCTSFPLQIITIDKYVLYEVVPC